MKVPGPTTARPTPEPSQYVDTTQFWNALKNAKLVLQYCPVTSCFQHPPRPVSTGSGRRLIEWREVSGLGSIYAFTVIRLPSLGLQGRTPLGIATIELDEGVRILGNLLNCAPGEPSIGARVQMIMDFLDHSQPYPAFELVR